jgi:hypothetical protein
MSMPEAHDPSADVKIRWVEPNFEPCRRANKVRDEERLKPLAGRAEVFAIDLHATSVHSALEWAKHFRAGLGPEDPPACLIVYGREIKPEEQVQFALAGIHALDVFRKELKFQRSGIGTSDDMLRDLLQSVVMARSLVASSVGTSRSASSPGDWSLYTTQPSHIPGSALNALFDELARDDRQWWERDF